MKPLLLVLLVVGACGLTGWTVYQQTKTTPLEATVGEESDEIVLYNTATGDVSRSEWVATPAVDPKSGKRILVPGMYCSKCQKWFPAPPPEMVERSPGGPVCPRDKTRLTVDGPLTSPKPAGG
ncbi:MAG: hypothetical protein V4719_23065 [Planctomycetota bacterium]